MSSCNKLNATLCNCATRKCLCLGSNLINHDYLWHMVFNSFHLHTVNRIRCLTTGTLQMQQAVCFFSSICLCPQSSPTGQHGTHYSATCNLPHISLASFAHNAVIVARFQMQGCTHRGSVMHDRNSNKRGEMLAHHDFVLLRGVRHLHPPCPSNGWVGNITISTNLIGCVHYHNSLVKLI